MTAQQPQNPTLRLLIAENSENEAHAFDSLLRDAGIATRTEVVDLNMALESMTEADMLLANSDLPELQQLMPNLRASAPNVPIILLNGDDASLTATAGLQLGAADVVPKSAPDHLVLVVKRELEKISQSQRLIETRRALEEAEQRCQLLLNSSKAAISYVHEGMHIYANAGYLELFGFEDSDELLGLPLIDLLDRDSADTLKAAMKQFRNDGAEVVFDFSGESTNGDAVHGNMTLAAAEYEGETCMQVTIRTAAAEPAPAAAAAAEDADVPTLEVAQDAGPGEGFELELVDTDNLPANGLSAEAPAASGQAAPSAAAGSAQVLSISEFLGAVADMEKQPATAVFAVEVDKFAELQNEHGISGAAEIAHQVENRLVELTGPSPITQLSNYQFALPIAAATNDSLLNAAQDAASAMENLMFEVAGKTVRPSVSLGGAVIDQSAPGSVEAALNQAFATLRAAIDDGGDRCVVLRSGAAETDAEHDDEASRVLRLVNEAIENQKFVLLFQPIISLRGDSDEHYEVFLRMLDRDNKQMAPKEFLRTAIDNGVAGKIDRWVILQSIKMLSTHRSKGHNTRLTINLTCNSIMDPEFLEWLGVTIKAARLPSDAVIFQVTEQDAASYVRQTREFLEGLQKMHCRASLSRFGLSEDPFELLKHVPADFVKLDGQKIDNISANAELRESVTEMIRELQGAGKLTIVPMVESATVLSALWQAGANYIQGHYLQEPSTEMDYDFSTDD